MIDLNYRVKQDQNEKATSRNAYNIEQRFFDAIVDNLLLHELHKIFSVDYDRYHPEQCDKNQVKSNE